VFANAFLNEYLDFLTEFYQNLTEKCGKFTE